MQNIHLAEVDNAMEAYFIATDKKLPPLRSKPVLSDFYHPSDQQKNNEILFIISSQCWTWDYLQFYNFNGISAPSSKCRTIAFSRYIKFVNTYMIFL